MRMVYSLRVKFNSLILLGALRMRIFGGMTWLRYRGLRSTPFTMCGDDSVWDYIIDANVWVVVSSGSGTCAAGPNSVGTTKIDFLLLLLLATLYVIL